MRTKKEVEEKLAKARAENKKISKEYDMEKNELSKKILRDLRIITLHEIFVLRWVLRNE